MLQVILAMSKEEVTSPLFDTLASYSLLLIKALSSEFDFIKIWHKRIIEDGDFQKDKIEEFISRTGKMEQALKVFYKNL